jgi:hypothetical protein
MYIKGIPNGFPCRICVIHAREMSRDFWKALACVAGSLGLGKILEPQASVFLRFPKVEQHPKCMDHAILLGKPFGNGFIK